VRFQPPDERRSGALPVRQPPGYGTPARAVVARKRIAASRGSLGHVRPGSERATGMTTNLFTISLTVLGTFLLFGGIAKFITP
jgi:hypothetical protein